MRRKGTKICEKNQVFIYLCFQKIFTMRYKLILSYDGSAFSGWQRQDNAPSVQEALETALATLMGGQQTSVTGAGRTDTGVHAVNYAAHFDASAPIENPDKFKYRLNAILPVQIAVHSIEAVSDDFHARFSATQRTYKYYIHTGKAPFLREYSWSCRYALDVDRMNRACALLPGTHDCSCFEKKGSDNQNSLCTITYARWEILPPSQMDGNCRRLVFTVSANRFLRNMVRAIVGTMVDIGRGAREPEYITQILDGGGSRSDAGQSVPGHALFLVEVKY